MQVISKPPRSEFVIKNEELDKLDALVPDMLKEFASLGQIEVKVTS